MRQTLTLLLFSAFSITTALLVSCSSSGFRGTVVPNALIITSDGDTLRGKILQGSVLTTTILTEVGDTLTIDNELVEKILALPSMVDATEQFIDTEKIRIELAKRAVLEKREKLREDVKAGLRKKTELSKAPLALLATILRLPQGQPAQVQITVLNLSPKKIITFRASVTCLDARGRGVPRSTGGKSSFEAISRFPINPDDEFSTALILRQFPGTKKVKVEIIAVQFADKTTWQGRILEMSP
jgi:hypothetical protein